MPLVSFDSLPDDSRVWVFGSDRALSPEVEESLLKRVDDFLRQWKAHGEPLTVAREWRDGRFLVVAVDQTTAGASGCSIDGLFRILQQVQHEAGANLVGGGRVFFRDQTGAVSSVERGEVEELARKGGLSRDSVVFDTTLTDLGAWRRHFERPARESWVGGLLSP